MNRLSPNFCYLCRTQIFYGEIVNDLFTPWVPGCFSLVHQRCYCDAREKWKTEREREMLEALEGLS